MSWCSRAAATARRSRAAVFRTYADDNLRYSQLAPLDDVRPRRTPARTCRPRSRSRRSSGDAYKLLFMAKGGGSANKSLLFQETKALLNPESLLRWLDEKLRTLGTAACPPYHLALVIGGTSAEFALKTAKLASARYLDTLPRDGNDLGRGFRDVELEQQVLALTQQFGIGAQFGGKYFCHDVRVIRLPRHGASCPVALAVSCSADRQSLGKITADGVFIEQLETDPAQVPPRRHRRRSRRRVRSSRSTSTNRWTRSANRLSQYPVQHARDADRLPGRRTRHRARQDQGAPRRRRRHSAVPAATTASTTRGPRRPRTATRRARSDRRPPVAWTPTSICSRRNGGSLVMLAKGNRSKVVTDACHKHGGFYLGLDRRPGGAPRQGLHHQGRGARVSRARHGSRLEDRGRDFPAFIVVDDKGNDFFAATQMSVTEKLTPSRARSERLSATALRPPP